MSASVMLWGVLIFLTIGIYQSYRYTLLLARHIDRLERRIRSIQERLNDPMAGDDTAEIGWKAW